MKSDGAEVISLLTLIVGPFYAPWFNRSYYLGQGTPNVWHNPTTLMVRPFALLAFALLCYMLSNIEKGEHIPRRMYWGLSGILFITTLAKPSFIQSLIPALGIYILLQCVILKFRTWKQCLCICLCFIPPVLIMLYQFLQSFFRDERGEGIGIGWLEVYSQQSPNCFVSAFLVLIFPLAYILLNYRKLIHYCDLRLAWLNFGVAWLEGALLFENGPRKADGNFGWACILAYSILWVVTAKYFFKDWKEVKSGAEVYKNLFLAVVFGLHVIFGGYYIYSLITVPGLWL